LNQEYEDLKLKYDRLNRDYENLANDKNVQKVTTSGQEKKVRKFQAILTFEQIEFELKVYKDKVAQLEAEIEDLKREKDEANERADELQQATQDLLVKLESYKLKDKNNVIIINFFIIKSKRKKMIQISWKTISIKITSSIKN